MVIGDNGSVEGINAFIYCTKWRSGQVLPMPYGQTLKDGATHFLIKYKSGALVTQLDLVGSTVRYEVMKLCTGSV